MRFMLKADAKSIPAIGNSAVADQAIHLGQGVIIGGDKQQQNIADSKVVVGFQGNTVAVEIYRANIGVFPRGVFLAQGFDRYF